MRCIHLTYAPLHEGLKLGCCYFVVTSYLLYVFDRFWALQNHIQGFEGPQWQHPSYSNLCNWSSPFLYKPRISTRYINQQLASSSHWQPSTEHWQHFVETHDLCLLQTSTHSVETWNESKWIPLTLHIPRTSKGLLERSSAHIHMTSGYGKQGHHVESQSGGTWNLKHHHFAKILYFCRNTHTNQDYQTKKMISHDFLQHN